jgi:hypothetical protein
VDEAIEAYEAFFMRNQPVRDTVIEKLRRTEAPLARPRRTPKKTARPAATARAQTKRRRA